MLVWKCCFWLTTNEGSRVAYKTRDMKSHLGQNLKNWKSYMLLSILICSILAIIWTSHQTLLTQFLSFFIPCNLVSLAAVFGCHVTFPQKHPKNGCKGDYMQLRWRSAGMTKYILIQYCTTIITVIIFIIIVSKIWVILSKKKQVNRTVGITVPPLPTWLVRKLILELEARLAEWIPIVAPVVIMHKSSCKAIYLNRIHHPYHFHFSYQYYDNFYLHSYQF